MNIPRKPGTKKSAPKNRASQISAARREAFDILLAVERGHGHSDDLLRGKNVDALTAADRHLATALVLGVLRWQLALDAQLQSLLARPNARLDVHIHIALRMGAFQILHMERIPARAAIDESVELAKRSGHRFASGMVNAVLRKLAASRDAEELDAYDAVKAHPAWLVERWTSFYGNEAALQICRRGQTQPPHTLRLASAGVAAELAEAGIVVEPGSLLTSARTVVSGNAAATAAFAEGRLRMQDEGSQLVAEIAAANLKQPDGRILDCCAAPGGKTMILAERHPRASIVAGESSPARLEHLKHRLAAYADRVECRLADATHAIEDEAFDLVLADVPCSGTGTLGRNPEIRHRLNLDDLAEQAQRQRAILTAALRAVRPGCRVVYSTCSLEPEENQQVVAAVLADMPNARAVRLDETIDALGSAGILANADILRASLTPQSALMLLPGTFNTDGFFIAVMERTA